MVEPCPERSGSAAEALFDGPGEMRALCRRLDWSATPLGAVEGWPTALRTAVAMAMEAPLGMGILWGPALAQIYNDTCRSFMGSRHPAALGRPVRDCWPEVWDFVGPLCERVMRGRESFVFRDRPMVIARHGTPEEACFSFTFSALPGGEPAGGVLVTVSETTAEVRSRRLASEHARIARALEAQPTSLLADIFRKSPSFLLVLRGPEHVFELANEAYYQLVGHRELLGRPVFEAIPEAVQGGFPEELARVLETGEPFAGKELEVTLERTPGAPPEQRFVDLVYLPLTDPDGRRTRVLVHGTDVTEHVRQRREAEAALAASRTRFQRLSQALERLAAADTRRDLLEVVLDSALALADADAVSVVLREGDQCHHVGEKSTAGPLWEGRRFPLASCVAGWTMQHRQTAVIADVCRDERVPHGQYEPTFVKSLVMVPIGRTEASAALGAYWARRHQPSAEEIAVLEALARTTGPALARRETEVRLRESEERFRVLVEGVAQSVWEADAGGVLADSPTWRDYTGQSAEEFLDRGWLDAIHPEDREHVLRAWREALAARRPADAEFRIRHKTGGWRWTHTHVAPLLSPSGKVQKWVGMNIDITERKRAEQRVRDAALHDPLTGLPNRRLVFEYATHLMAAAARQHGRGALLFIDLDRFKPVNDLYGHETGDLLLQEVARRLLANVRSEDLVGRLGGDEFVIVLPHLQEPRDAMRVARQVVAAISAPFRLRDHDVSVSLSIGISLFPRHGRDIDTLIHAADLAMYQAKQTGRGSCHLYTPDLDRRASESSMVEAKLKQALERGGLALHYQPVIDMRGGRPSGVEALLRLTGEDGRRLGPNRFIPVAEAAGLIGALGEWVAAEACRQHAAWCREGLPPIPIAINVSPLQFRQRAFAQRLAAIVREAGVDPSFLQVEVTESTVMDSVDDAIQILKALKSAGIRVALDDFGTGYSSLSHLSRLPLDKLKVDQSFVRRIDDDRASRAITEAIIALGRTLELEVVGEGIDSPQALAYLHAHGCSQGQGYLFSRPLPEREFAAWYRKHAG